MRDLNGSTKSSAKSFANMLWKGWLSSIALGIAFCDPVAAQTDSARILRFDFPEVHVGVAEYEEGPTGTTVFYFPDGVTAAADIRGGSPGTLNAPTVRLGYEDPFIDAVVFSGGSWYGLSAATGAANAIGELKREEGERDFVAGVLGGIIFDVGGRRFSRITPDEELGAAALHNARPNWFPLGARGAGRFAMQGMYFSAREGADSYAGSPHSGQGGAFRQIGPTKVLVFTVVNAAGTIVDRQGGVVRCHRNDPTTECPYIADLIDRTLDRRGRRPKLPDGPTRNTTLTLVVTNQKLGFSHLQRLAIQVHTSMARAIQPFATEHDGDVLYAVTTNQVENPDLSAHDLSFFASEVAWDAVINSVPELQTRLPMSVEGESPGNLARYIGAYRFPGGSSLNVAVEADSLTATFTGDSNIYFDERRTYRLMPAGAEFFVVDAPARDLVRFDIRAGSVSGLTVNPGAWEVTAQRLGGNR